MSGFNHDGESFYLHAIELLSKAGHVFTSNPVFANHPPEQFVFFDSKTDLPLSREQRLLLRLFGNVSYLFEYNNCAFFSLELFTTKSDRSQAAYDIHMLIHPLIGSEATILFSQHDDEMLLSFMGFGYQCVLSDWYPIEDDFDQLLNRLDIANVSISRSIDYFTDMVYILGRNYYLYGQPSTYDILPIDFITRTNSDGVDRDELDKFIEFQLTAPRQEYGDDYVAYDKSTNVQLESISAELNLMLLEMADEDDDDDNSFGEELEPEDDIDDDKSIDGDADNTGLDEYEFDDVDPEIFRDPLLMVKWINHHSQD